MAVRSCPELISAAFDGKMIFIRSCAFICGQVKASSQYLDGMALCSKAGNRSFISYSETSSANGCGREDASRIGKTK